VKLIGIKVSVVCCVECVWAFSGHGHGSMSAGSG